MGKPNPPVTVSGTAPATYTYSFVEQSTDGGGGGGGTTVCYTVTVNYYDKEIGASIAEKYSGRKLRGSSYDVTAKDAIDIAGYAYDSTSGDYLKGTLRGNKVINVYYIKDAEPAVEPVEESVLPRETAPPAETLPHEESAPRRRRPLSPGRLRPSSFWMAMPTWAF